MNILVTGANGFVGSSLIKRLATSGHKITALVRSNVPTEKIKNVSFIQGDLLKPKVLPALEKIDKAFYLVHGLKGQVQNFEYEETCAAMNFVNWIKSSKPDIIYLGGLSPENESLSPHLRSRVLTGNLLALSGLSVLEFRASIILGSQSLSFEMIKAMAERLPFRPDLSLLDHPCQPLALKDLLDYLVAALDFKVNEHEIVEIGGPEKTSYGELIELYSSLAGLKRKKIKLPEVESKVLMKALDYVVPEYSQVGKKLTESLEHPTIVTDEKAKDYFPKIRPLSLKDAMSEAKEHSSTHYAPLWEKDFLKMLLSDRLLTQSGLISPDLLKSLEKVGKLKDILVRK